MRAHVSRQLGSWLTWDVRQRKPRMVFLAVIFYFTPLVIAPAYFWRTRGGARRYTKEMWIGFALQLFWTACVWFAVHHLRIIGNPDWFFAWYYLVPVNLVGDIYFASMPIWTSIYKRPKNA